jgi:putative transposase
LKTGCLLTISRKAADSKGFEVIPKRWIVERTFAWLSNFRRMSKDYERSPLTSKSNILFNMITIVVFLALQPIAVVFSQPGSGL